MERILPQHLRKGDRVSLVSASSPVPSEDIVQRSVCSFRALGLDVLADENVMSRFGYLAGSDKSRVESLNRALLHPETAAVFFAWGGKGATHLLPHIDYNGFRESPKIVVGLSDSSCIVNVLSAKTGVVTFHGPTGVNFGDPRGLAGFTRRSLQRTLFDPYPIGSLPEHSKWSVLRTGSATGHLMGGHLSTLLSLVGTPYEPRWEGAIFFWEEVGRPARAIDLGLWQLRLSGVLSKISGMIVGRPLQCDDPEFDKELGLQATILQACEGYDFPILYNVDLGHADPKLTLPLGAEAEIVLSDSADPIFRVVTPAVR